MTTYEKIKDLCEKNGFSISALEKKIPNLSISRASITGWKNGSKPRPEKLRLIADYFGVPISYFNETANQTIQDNHGIIGNTHAPVTINNDSESKLGDIEKELLSICSKLDMKRKNALLAKAYELLEEV